MIQLRWLGLYGETVALISFFLVMSIIGYVGTEIYKLNGVIFLFAIFVGLLTIEIMFHFSEKDE